MSVELKRYAIMLCYVIMYYGIICYILLFFDQFYDFYCRRHSLMN